MRDERPLTPRPGTGARAVVPAPRAANGDERTEVDAPPLRLRPPRPAVAEDDGEALVGSTLGSYRLLARIGKGGMGHVYRAEHVRLGREVALKLLRQDYAKRKDAVARFFQEARTVNRARHRNIVDVTDFVELEDGTTFIIMELLTGQGLGSWARTGIELPRALAVLVQICEGLAAAHAVNVVHRDLKPDNVFISQTPQGDVVKLLDFGVAKLINQTEDDLGVETAAGSVVGTPAYMSPEQAGGMPIDGRSDIYSLGAIMYELFCGQTMFRGRSFGEFVRKHLTEQPTPPRATPRGATLDPRIEAIILRAIEKDPARRYQSIVELRDALLTLLQNFQAPAASSQPQMTALPGESARLPKVPVDPSAIPLVEITMESMAGQIDALSSAQRASARTSHPPMYHQITGQLERATPWWVWFVGGAVAVGLGIGGATWYVRSTSPAPELIRGAAAPAAMPEPPALPTLIELRLRSEPTDSAVYKEGSTTELCRTPCSLNLDPTEYGSITMRPFVLRHPGFQDTALVIDLRGAQREFHVALVAAAEAPTPPALGSPPAPSTPEATIPTATSTPTTADPTGNDRRVKPRPRKEPTGAEDSAPASGDLPDLEPTKPSTKDAIKPAIKTPMPPTPGTNPPDPDPGSGALPDKPLKPAGKIDRSETLDPFRTRP